MGSQQPVRDSAWLQAVEHYLGSLGTPDSVRAMRTAFGDVARLLGRSDRDYGRLDLSALDPARVRQVVGHSQLSGYQQRKVLAALRGAARSAAELRLLDTADYEYLKAMRLRTRREKTKGGRYVEDNELSQLIELCEADERPAGARDAALLAFAYQTGARRAELCALTNEPKRFVEASEDCFDLLIEGKGRKERWVHLAGYGGLLLGRWLEARGDALGAVFCAIRKGGSVQPDHQLSPQALHKILHKRVVAAGLERLGWHDWRRKFGSDLFARGLDAKRIADMMGHEDVKTTMGYDRRKQEERKDDFALLDTPRDGA